MLARSHFLYIGKKHFGRFLAFWIDSTFGRPLPFSISLCPILLSSFVMSRIFQKHISRYWSCLFAFKSPVIITNLAFLRSQAFDVTLYISLTSSSWRVLDASAKNSSIVVHITQGSKVLYLVIRIVNQECITSWVDIRIFLLVPVHYLFISELFWFKIFSDLNVVTFSWVANVFFNYPIWEQTLFVTAQFVTYARFPVGPLEGFDFPPFTHTWVAFVYPPSEYSSSSRSFRILW